MLNKKQLTVGLVGAGLLWCLGAPAHASYGSSVITTGSNTFEDQSREAYFDTNNDGLFGVGDILTGYIRIDDKTKPNSVDLENHIYAIFSQQVVEVIGNTVIYGAINPADGTGLSLSELGVAGAISTDMVALYSSTASPSGYTTDMILNSPGDLTGNGTVTLADYFKLIIDEGVLDIRAGLTDGPVCTGGTADCFAATSALAGAPNSTFIDLADSITVANFVAGLETSLDPAGYVIEDVTQAGVFYPPLAPITISELAISNGAVRGSFGVANYLEWTDGSELSALAQCTNVAGQTEICGFVNDADFTFYAVPEPASIALMGLGLFGLGAARRRQRRHMS